MVIVFLWNRTNMLETNSDMDELLVATLHLNAQGNGLFILANLLASGIYRLKHRNS